MHHGIVQPRGAGQNVAEIVERFGKVRFDTEDLMVATRGFGEPSGLMMSNGIGEHVLDAHDRCLIRP